MEKPWWSTAPDAAMVKPASDTDTVRFIDALGGGLLGSFSTDAPPAVGVEMLMSPSAAAKVVVASMNMITLVTMSRYGMRLSSPPSSAIASPWSRILRILARKRPGVIG